MNPEEPKPEEFKPAEPKDDPAPAAPKVVGYCRACGKPLDEITVRNAHGTIYCQEHIPMQQQTVPPMPIPAGPAPEPSYASPYSAAAPASARSTTANTRRAWSTSSSWD
jgi:hypothetical protein